MLGAKIYKSDFDAEKYAELASWCNSQEYKTIEDKGEYYEVVDCTPTQEEQNAMRAIQIKQEIADINNQLTELDCANACTFSVDDNDEVDVIVGGKVVTMTTAELDERYDTLADKRIQLIQELKAVQ